MRSLTRAAPAAVAVDPAPGHGGAAGARAGASASTNGGASRRPRGMRARRLSASSRAPHASSSSIAIESYLRLKKKGALAWSTRYLVLRNAQLASYYSKEDAEMRRRAMEVLQVQSGQVAKLRTELGLTIRTTDGKEYSARAFNRGDLAKWITAFHRLEVKRAAKAAASASASASASTMSDSRTSDSSEAVSTAPSSTASDEGCVQPTSKAPPARRVTFHGSVLVRTIPVVPTEQLAELFYSRKELDEFSTRASSLLGRTEHAMNRAYLSLSLRRPRATTSTR